VTGRTSGAELQAHAAGRRCALRGAETGLGGRARATALYNAR
jgi:hypothetical protein